MFGAKVASIYDFIMWVFIIFMHVVKVWITFIVIAPIVISVTEWKQKKKMISVSLVLDVLLRTKRNFPIRNIPVFGVCWVSAHNVRFFHLGKIRFWGCVTYFSCLFMSNMSHIVLFPGMDLAGTPLAPFGISILVFIEIGSLARFTWFCNVDLSCIFWSISNPFFQNTVFPLFMCILSSLWNSLQ